ncbi:MAG: PAS domain S-box protein [Syntrophales bacterium]|jgi:PAS domain S-box-containing protein|nr:PAS domain S-box protein [Syntrophales bacterium]
MARKKTETRGASELRRRAEKRLKTQRLQTEPSADRDPQRLLHEMQVHRVELELQNEELKRLRDEAETLVARYLDIYDFAPVGYFSLSPDGKILQANLRGARLVGLPRAELVGRSFTALVSAASRPAFKAFFEETLRTEKPESCEVEVSREGKPPLLVQLEGSAFLERGECRLAMIDVTERRRAEEGMRRYDLLARHGRDIILFADSGDGRILEANAAAEKAYGYSREELLELTVHHLLAAGDFEAAPQNGGNDDQTHPLSEALHRRRDGTVFPVEVSLHREEVGGRRVAISIIRDISLRRKAETALGERSRQLESANRELEAFSYSVSHDLQAPLRAIDGYARMILKKQGARFDDDTRAKFDVIRSSIVKMGQLINDLLAMARLGRLEMRFCPVDIEAMVREVWEELTALQPGRVMTLRIESLPPAVGDRSLLRQIVANILSNAVKFTRLRGETILEVAGRRQGDEVLYSFRDNGVGFNKVYHDKLFGMFQRLHTAEEYEGTGVGLAIAQRIVQRHGGRIWAESEEGKGATFYFTLPADQSRL